MKIVRVSFDRIKVYRCPLISSGDVAPVNPWISADDVAAPAPGNSMLSLEPAPLEGWIGRRSKWPRANIDFEVADADRPRMLQWLTGSASGSVAAPGERLLKDMTAAVKRALSGYYDDAARANLFTAPFMAGVALRNEAGFASVVQTPALIVPNATAPVVAIDSFSLPAGRLESIADITNLPHSLRLDCARLRMATDLAGYSFLEIIAMPQAAMLPDDFTVDSIVSASVDGEARKTYHYNTPSESSLADEASVQTDVRVIASVPVEEIPTGGILEVNPLAGGLANWKLLKKFTLGGNADDGGNHDDGDDGDNGTDLYDPSECTGRVNLETEPLDLGMPDTRKWVRRVWLRGRYERGAVTIVLYASRHRERWIRVASGRRGWISAMARAGFRWWKVRISGTLRPADFLDALTFEIENG